MAVYVTEKERDAILAVCDFISTNADGADDYTFFEEMQTNLMALFHKAKKDAENHKHKALVKKYLKKLRQNKII